METASDLTWWDEPPHVELREIMDELDPGWSVWSGTRSTES